MVEKWVVTGLSSFIFGVEKPGEVPLSFEWNFKGYKREGKVFVSTWRRGIDLVCKGSFSPQWWYRNPMRTK